jgi:hypothetical protein
MRLWIKRLLCSLKGHGGVTCVDFTPGCPLLVCKRCGKRV